MLRCPKTKLETACLRGTAAPRRHTRSADQPRSRYQCEPMVSARLHGPALSPLLLLSLKIPDIGPKVNSVLSNELPILVKNCIPIHRSDAPPGGLHPRDRFHQSILVRTRLAIRMVTILPSFSAQRAGTSSQLSTRARRRRAQKAPRGSLSSYGADGMRLLLTVWGGTTTFSLTDWGRAALWADRPAMLRG